MEEQNTLPDLPIYIIGCHGSSKNPLTHTDMDKIDFYVKNTQQNEINIDNFINDSLKVPTTDELIKSSFLVPDDVHIVYFNDFGTMSRGNRNIPFITHLYKYNKDLFDYMFNPNNYVLNQDKQNISSYRHPDFFKTFPFYSNTNNLCNFELYPPHSHCPRLDLFFDPEDRTYFGGITEINNIIPSNFMDPVEIIDNDKVHKDISYTSNGEKHFNFTTKMLIQWLKKEKGITKGFFFISACRAIFYEHNNMVSNKNEITHIDIDSIEKKCNDYKYNNQYIDNLISSKYKNNLETKITLTYIKQLIVSYNNLYNYNLGIINNIYKSDNTFYNRISLKESLYYVLTNPTNVTFSMNLNEISNMSTIKMMIEYIVKFNEINGKYENNFKTYKIDVDSIIKYIGKENSIKQINIFYRLLHKILFISEYNFTKFSYDKYFDHINDVIASSSDDDDYNSLKIGINEYMGINKRHKYGGSHVETYNNKYNKYINKINVLLNSINN
jgi:hypothetical protein